MDYETLNTAKRLLRGVLNTTLGDSKLLLYELARRTPHQRYEMLLEWDELEDTNIQSAICVYLPDEPFPHLENQRTSLILNLRCKFALEELNILEQLRFPPASYEKYHAYILASTLFFHEWAKRRILLVHCLSYFWNLPLSDVSDLDSRYS